MKRELFHQASLWVGGVVIVGCGILLALWAACGLLRWPLKKVCRLAWYGLNLRELRKFGLLHDWRHPTKLFDDYDRAELREAYIESRCQRLHRLGRLDAFERPWYTFPTFRRWGRMWRRRRERKDAT